MCITSCKNSRFSEPSKPLNPHAKEWRPPHHLRRFHSPLPSAAAHSLQKLQWQLPPPPLAHQPHHTFMPYLPHLHLWPRIAHHSTHSFPSPPRFHEAPPLLHGGDKKHVAPPEGKSCLGKIEASKNVLNMGRPLPTTPPHQGCEWRPWRRAVGRSKVGAAAATPPRKKVPAASFVDEKLSSSRTTVMIKNIPNQLRRDSLLEFLDSYSSLLSLEYDFMYLPMDFCKKDNLGYAFVNFTSSGAALKFKGIAQNYKWGTVKTEKGFSYTSMKICEVTWARIQGKESLLRRFEDSKFACDNPGFLPVVFDPPRGGGSNTPPVIVGSVKG